MGVREMGAKVLCRFCCRVRRHLEKGLGDGAGVLVDGVKVGFWEDGDGGWERWAFMVYDGGGGGNV